MITINTANNEQTLIIERALRRYIGNERVKSLSLGDYTRLFNELASLVFDDDAHSIEFVDVDQGFLARYY